VPRIYGVVDFNRSSGEVPRFTFFVAFVAITLGPHICRGQVSVVQTNSFEVGGFAGASYGVDKFRPMGGGNVTYAINKWLLPYAEYSYFPGIARTFSEAVPGVPNAVASGTFSVPLSDFHGGVHIRIPIRESPIVPYLVVGVGGLHHFAKTEDITFTGAGTVPIQLTSTAPAGTDFAANFGGGIRYYINQRFGLRVEAKAYKPNSAFTSVFGKVEFGLFFQLR
jgi:hypothetical protein